MNIKREEVRAMAEQMADYIMTPVSGERAERLVLMTAGKELAGWSWPALRGCIQIHLEGFLRGMGIEVEK